MHTIGLWCVTWGHCLSYFQVKLHSLSELIEKSDAIHLALPVPLIQYFRGDFWSANATFKGDIKRKILYKGQVQI